MQRTATRRIVAAAAVLALGAALQIASAQAEDPSASDIVRSLQPKAVKTRSLDPGKSAREAKTRSLVNKLQSIKTRQITVEERKEIATVVKENDLPAVDLEVFFEFDSADITPEAKPTLEKLGQALSSDELKGSIFLVNGHTDAKGGDEYNLALSNARANSVRAYLIEEFDIGSDQLVAVGFGEEQLKNADDPFADENRRVQVINVAKKETAAAE